MRFEKNFVKEASKQFFWVLEKALQDLKASVNTYIETENSDLEVEILAYTEEIKKTLAALEVLTGLRIGRSQKQNQDEEV